MGYTIGVSTGIFSAASPEEKRQYVGLPHKAMYSMFKGVMFAQIDLESVSEYKEPDLNQKMEEVRKMGIEYGLHAEVPEYSKAYPKLESALIEEWRRSHERAITELEGAGKIKAKYLLFHSSTTEPFLLLWHAFQPSNVCDIWGRPLKQFLNENENLLWWALEKGKEYITNAVSRRIGGFPTLEEAKETIRERIASAQMAERKEGKEPKAPSEKEIEEKAKAGLKKEFFDAISKDDPTYGTERVAYYIIAKWMQEGGKTCPPALHQLWKNIAGSGKIEDKNFRDNHGKWVPAIAGAYHWGHFHPEKSPTKIDAKDPKKILEKYNMQVVFESPMAGAGGEEHVRLARISHIYHMVKAINHPLIGVAVDAEHMLSANIDPMKDVDRLPANGGEKIWVVHVGYPAPLAPAHIPIPLGSEAQMYTYKLLWAMRKKGMKDAVIIFERGGGKEPVKESILSLKKIKEYLEKDVKPEELPEDFFGMPRGGPRITRQLVQVRNHALDPLKGLLSVPEEEYGFLSTAAAAKGKLEEWKKGRELK